MIGLDSLWIIDFTMTAVQPTQQCLMSLTFKVSVTYNTQTSASQTASVVAFTSSK